MRKPSHRILIHPYFLISFAGLCALAIVFLILDSNTPQRQKSIEVAPTAEQSAAIQDLRQLLEEDPDDPVLQMEMGNSLFDIGRYEEAIPYYRNAVHADSSNIAAQIDLAICFFNLDRTEDALHEMKKALEIDPDHIKGLYNTGVIYYNLGEYDQAGRYWNKLIRLHETSPEAEMAKKLLEQIKSS